MRDYRDTRWDSPVSTYFYGVNSRLSDLICDTRIFSYVDRTLCLLPLLYPRMPYNVYGVMLFYNNMSTEICISFSFALLPPKSMSIFKFESRGASWIAEPSLFSFWSRWQHVWQSFESKLQYRRVCQCLLATKQEQKSVSRCPGNQADITEGSAIRQKKVLQQQHHC